MSTFELVSIAIGACLALSILSSAASSRIPKQVGSGPLSSFLLAGGNLTKLPVISLLVSSSSSLNSLFYQVWLGYSIGAWSLVAQGAWALSFFLLARYSTRVREAESLHGFLSARFGSSTRIVAALCSLAGFMALMGWEVALGRQVFGGFVATDSSMSVPALSNASAWLAALTVVGALIYTISGGMRGNALADVLQNLVKLCGSGMLMLVLLTQFDKINGDWASFWNAMFPSATTMAERIGWFGLITNVVFSLLWQLVDASTWQSMLAGARRSSDQQISADLRWSGATVFIAPGILGTVLGVSLTSMGNITQENILVQALAISGDGLFLRFFVFFAIAAAMMSLIDGLLIAGGYAIVVDLLKHGRSLDELDGDVESSIKILSLIRIALLGLAIMAAWGFQALTSAFGLSPFDTVYLVIVPQLALAGPVLLGLHRTIQPTGESSFIVWAIVIALTVGVGMTWVGTSMKLSILVDGAGTAAALTSLLLAIVLSSKTSKVRS